MYSKKQVVEYQSQYKLSDYTHSDFIHNDLFDQKIIYINKHVGHDGYDEDGPKSTIYDIDIIIKNDNEYNKLGKKDDYIFLNYHQEHWPYHNGGMEGDFTLDYFCKLSEVKSFYDIQKFKDHLKNPFVENTFLELYNKKMDEVKVIEAMPETRLKRLLPFHISSPFLIDVIKNNFVINVSLKHEKGPLYTFSMSHWHYYVNLILKIDSEQVDYSSNTYFFETKLPSLDKQNSDFILIDSLKLSEISNLELLKKNFNLVLDNEEYNNILIERENYLKNK